MRQAFRIVSLMALTIGSAVPQAALATTWQAHQIISKWVGSDRCVANAQKAFPDYTPEALAKRDQALQQCLTSSNLPTRSPQAPSATPQQ
jgi:hypothetical protein